MRIELEVAGHDVQFVSINKMDGVETQEEIVKHCAFPQLQDTEALDLWNRFAGGKDDFYIFDAEGKLHTYLQFYGPVGTMLSEDEDYQNVKNAILSVLDGTPPGPEPEPDVREGTEANDASPPVTDVSPVTDVGPEPDDADTPPDEDVAAQPDDTNASETEEDTAN